MNSEVRELLKQLRLAGCVVESRAQHHKVYVKGAFIGAVPKTPSDHRSVKNTVAQLRRAGVLLPRK